MNKIVSLIDIKCIRARTSVTMSGNSRNVNSATVFRPLTYPIVECKKARELNVLSELFPCLRGRRTDGGAGRGCLAYEQ